EKLQRKAHDLAVDISGGEDPRLCGIVQSLVYSIIAQGRYAEAEKLISSAMSKLRGVLDKHHPRALELVTAQAHLRGCEGKWADAETLHMTVFNSILSYGEGHPTVVFARSRLAKSCIWQGKFAEAETLYKKAIDYGKLAFGPKHREMANIVHDL